ncbi:uncharacterized protein LOC120943636 [Rana temporaria]|uniref:uncharacterized protein LOC120943636 n=1 Tax=Rana temporaria TaxID=8407 RepID=UPI001AADB5FC|nr:uncharacterized protein LOC120943636 [Rana temporaria]
MPGCMAKYCPNKTANDDKGNKISYFAFPKDDNRKKLWLKNAGMDPGMVEEYIPIIKKDTRSDNYRMCSAHFDPQSFTMRRSQRRLIPEAVPTIFIDVAKPTITGNKWLNKLKKIWTSEQIRASTCTTGNGSKLCSCDCHVSGQLQNVLKMEVSTQTVQNFIESEPSYSNTANPRAMGLDHPYSSREECPMSPTVKSTPVSHPLSEVQPLIEIDPSTSTLSPPSKRLRRTKSIFTSYLESPEVITKRKLTYVDDPSFHESDCETPQKSELSFCESINEIELEVEDTLPHPLCLVKENKFIVFESCLDKLLYSMMCPEIGCSSQIQRLEKQIIGTMVTVYSTCTGHHRLKLWDSQPKIKHYGAGNILLAGAITVTGGSYAKVSEMFDLCGIAMFGKTSFNRSQNVFVFKAIDISWEKNKENVTIEIDNKPLFLIGDGQCDSHGFSAKYSTYTFMDCYSKKIVDFELVQATQTTSSAAMEKSGFTKCLDRIIDNDLNVQMVGTDRHTGIRKLLSTTEKYKHIIHQFDLLHYVKKFRRKLTQIAKKKINEALLPWIRPIMNHLYYCSSHCNGKEHVFKEIWHSLLHHIVNEHEWEIENEKHKCLHDPISVDAHHVPWIKRKSPAYIALSAIVLDGQLGKDTKHLTYFCQPGILETYHSMILKFRPKIIHYRFDSMEARTKLAALCHNHNVMRNPALTKKKEIVERKNLEFPRGRKQWIVRNVYEKMDNQYAFKLLEDMISIVEGTITSAWVPKYKDMPKNIAPIQRPETSVAVKEHMTRFLKK